MAVAAPTIMAGPRNVRGSGVLTALTGAGVLLVGSLTLAFMTNGCAAPGPELDEPARQGPAESIVVASSRSTSALGVITWSITMVDGKYSVAGFDANRELRAGMQTETRDGPDEMLITDVSVDVGDLHVSKRYATKNGQTAFHHDDIEHNALALQALDLLGDDLASSGSALQASSIRPLDVTLTEQPGRGSGFEVYPYEGCEANTLCNKILVQTNLDCHGTAYCSKTRQTACGGSDTQCRKDQAYAKNAGCDRKCASKWCTTDSGTKLVCTKPPPATCSKDHCTRDEDAFCQKYGALCKDSQTARDERGDGSYGN